MHLRVVYLFPFLTERFLVEEGLIKLVDRTVSTRQHITLGGELASASLQPCCIPPYVHTELIRRKYKLTIAWSIHLYCPNNYCRTSQDLMGVLYREIEWWGGDAYSSIDGWSRRERLAAMASCLHARPIGPVRASVSSCTAGDSFGRCVTSL